MIHYIFTYKKTWHSFNVFFFFFTPTGGVRGTAFVHSPLLASKGRVSMDLMHLTDWLPTLYGRGGGDVHKLLNTDGHDMWPTLSDGEKSPRKELVHNIDPVTWTSAVRYQQWKLLANESKNVFYLFVRCTECSPVISNLEYCKLSVVSNLGCVPGVDSPVSRT